MVEHLTRDIHAVGASRAIPDLLRSIFAAELMRPSRRLWIVSAWVSDIHIMDNTSRQFSTICPEWPSGPVRLSTVLGALMKRGTQVILIVNATSHNEDIIARLRATSEEAGDLLTVIQSKELHEKGILGDHFTLDGSMNLTFNGVFVNDERLWYRRDRASVEQRRLELENRWRSQLCS